jgi:hypothetical protein
MLLVEWGRFHRMLLRNSSAATLIGSLCFLAWPALAGQEVRDPGVRGGFQNTAGMLQFRGISIPHPPVIRPNGKDAITANEQA